MTTLENDDKNEVASPCKPGSEAQVIHIIEVKLAR